MIATAIAAVLNFLGALLKAFVKYPWQILFGIACVVIFLMDTYRGPEIECPECPTYDTIKVKGDSIPYPDTTYIPTPVWRDTGSTRWRWHDIDTAAILAVFDDYYIPRFYLDTILDDTNGFVLLTDTVQYNKITGRGVQKTFFPHVYHYTKYITIPEEPVNLLLLGPGFGGNRDRFSASGKVSLLNKKKRLYTVSYNFMYQEVEVSTQWPIRLRK